MRRTDDGQQGGLRPGGLQEQADIKVLICCLLKNVGQPMTREQIDEVLPGSGMVRYFEYSQAMASLETGRQIELTPEGYRVTSSGRHNAGVLEDTLPHAIRERSLRNAITVLRRGDVLRENRVSNVEENGQVYLVCTMLDGENELMTVKTAVGSPEISTALGKSFLKSPEILYKAVFAALSGDPDLMRQVLLLMNRAEKEAAQN